MNDNARYQVARNAIEMKASLDVAMEEAGGAPFNTGQLSNMSALEFISVLCTNWIRFTYTGPNNMTKKRREGDSK